MFNYCTWFWFKLPFLRCWNKRHKISRRNPITNDGFSKTTISIQNIALSFSFIQPSSKKVETSQQQGWESTNPDLTFPWLSSHGFAQPENSHGFKKNTVSTHLTTPRPCFLSLFNHNPWGRFNGWSGLTALRSSQGSNFSNNNLRPPEIEGGPKFPQMLVQTQQTEIKLKQKILRFFRFLTTSFTPNLEVDEVGDFFFF